MTSPAAPAPGVSVDSPSAPKKGTGAPRSVLWRIVWEFGWPWRWTYVWSLVWMALNGLLDVGVVVLVGPFVDGLKAGTIPVEPILLFWAVCGIMTYFVARSITSFLGEYLLFKASMGSVNDARKKVFGHLSSMDLAFFQAHPAGMLMSRVTGDTANLTNMFSKILVCVGRDAPKLIGLVGVTVFLDWRLALLAYVLMPLAIWPISALGRKVRKIAKRAQSQGAFFGARLVETIRGIRMVKLYGAETSERARVHDLIETMRKLAFRGERTKTILAPLTETLIGLTLGAVVIYGGFEVMAGTMNEGTVVSFLTAIVLAYSPAKGLANLHVDLQGVVASGERLYEVMDARPILLEAPDARPLADGPGRVCLEDVCFSYPSDGDSAVRSDMKRLSQGGRAGALRHVTLNLEPGQTVALVGPSGGGKSTIINMIARLYDPTSGRVLIDGQDLREVTFRSLWARMSLVSQDVAIFDDTVRANIAYGCPQVSDDAIYRAIRLAGAEDFVRDLPHGIESQLGERGCSLSGGQRQRISIARAFLKDAPILLLDEPTSALDGETERFVQQAFSELMVGRTTLVIAHRLSTIRQANRIYVLEHGRIVQSGTHDDLASVEGVYARLLAAHELGA